MIIALSNVSVPQNVINRIKIFEFDSKIKAIQDKNGTSDKEFGFHNLKFYPLDSSGAKLDVHSFTNIDLTKFK